MNDDSVYDAAVAASTTRDRVGELEREVANLQAGLKTRTVISAAVGIFMATYKVTYDEAFHLLVVHSQRTNRKLRDIADVVVYSGAPPDQ